MTGGYRALSIAAIVAAVGFVTAAATSEKDAVPQSAAGSTPAHPLFAAGYVEPQTEERDIAATAIGRIILVKAEGDPVKMGDIVAEIENDDRKAAVDAAEARLSIRQAELARLLAGARYEERKEAEAALREVEAQLGLAKSVVERRIPLAQTGIASTETVDHAQADYAAALARQNLMAQRLALITAPPRAEDVMIARSNVAAAKAEIADAQAQLELTRLRSPIDGILLKRYKLQGETVTNQPPTLVATVGDVSRLRVRAQIDETDVARIAVGQNVFVTADAFRDRRFPGKVIRVGGRLGPKYLKTELPAERIDTKILEAIVDLDGEPPLPIGLRVDVTLDSTPGAIAAIGNFPPSHAAQSESPTAKAGSRDEAPLAELAPSAGPPQDNALQIPPIAQPSNIIAVPAAMIHSGASAGSAPVPATGAN